MYFVAKSSYTFLTFKITLGTICSLIEGFRDSSLFIDIDLESRMNCLISKIRFEKLRVVIHFPRRLYFLSCSWPCSAWRWRMSLVIYHRARDATHICRQSRRKVVTRTASRRCNFRNPRRASPGRDRRWDRRPLFPDRRRPTSSLDRRRLTVYPGRRRPTAFPGRPTADPGQLPHLVIQLIPAHRAVLAGMLSSLV